LFLERESYRKNRLRDAAALMPVFGGLLFFGPAFILTPREQLAGGISFWLVYFFAVWTILIVITYILSRALRQIEREDASAGLPDPAADPASGEG
jgi:hypothetical protein